MWSHPGPEVWILLLRRKTTRAFGKHGDMVKVLDFLRNAAQYDLHYPSTNWIFFWKKVQTCLENLIGTLCCGDVMCGWIFLEDLHAFAVVPVRRWVCWQKKHRWSMFDVWLVFLYCFACNLPLFLENKQEAKHSFLQCLQRLWSGIYMKPNVAMIFFCVDWAGFASTSTVVKGKLVSTSVLIPMDKECFASLVLFFLEPDNPNIAGTAEVRARSTATRSGQESWGWVEQPVQASVKLSKSFFGGVSLFVLASTHLFLFCFFRFVLLCFLHLIWAYRRPSGQDMVESRWCKAFGGRRMLDTKVQNSIFSRFLK